MSRLIQHMSDHHFQYDKQYLRKFSQVALDSATYY